jgi:hypothetical protein
LPNSFIYRSNPLSMSVGLPSGFACEHLLE